MSPRSAVPQPTRESVAGWLRAMTPARRHALAALLAEPETAALMAEIRREAAYEATRTDTSKAVAEQFGTTVRVITRLIREHNEARDSAAAQPQTPDPSKETA